MKFKRLLAVRLNLFDGATGTGAEGGGETSGETQADRGATRRGKSGENVLYGKQNTEPSGKGLVTEAQDKSSVAGKEVKTDVVTTSDTLDERRRAFRDMVNGQYKDVYSEEVQRIIDRRFKETRTLESELEKSKPIMDMLMQRYKISGGDTAALAKAIENDDVYWSEAADEAGMSVEQYKQFQKLQRENEAFREARKRAETQSLRNNQVQQWVRDAETLKGKFPNFSLEAETQNPEFLSLLSKGVPVEHAYKLLHMDEIVSDAMRTTAADTEKRVVDNVRAKGARPNENGTAAQSAFTIRDDVTKLSKKDRAEIARRAARGEKIVF